MSRQGAGGRVGAALNLITDGAQTAEGYLVLATNPGLSFAELGAAWTAGAASQVAITGAAPGIGVAAFTLSDLTGSVTRWVIVTHTDSVSSVPTCELITITFHPHA